MVGSLAARSEVDLIIGSATESACIRQRYARAIRTVLKNLNSNGFPVSLNLPFYDFE